MVNVCVSNDFRVVDGRLGLAVVPAPGDPLLGVDSGSQGGYASGQWTEFGAITTLPGRFMARAWASYVNALPFPIRVDLAVTRPSIELRTTNPNAAQLRCKWGWELTEGTFVEPPAESPRWPDPSDSYDMALGVSLDLGASSGGVPMSGAIRRAWDASSVREPSTFVVYPGQTIAAFFTMYLWTPPPWSNNANNNNPYSAFRALGLPDVTLYRAADMEVSP